MFVETYRSMSTPPGVLEAEVRGSAHRRYNHLVRPRLVITLLVAIGAVSASARAQERADWWRRAPVTRSRHYIIRTDLPRLEAQAYGRHLDLMYDEYSRRLASLRPRAPEMLRVYIFSTYAEYERTLKTRFDVTTTGTGGLFFVNPHGNGLALWTGRQSAKRIRGLIQHEAFHQFAYSRFEADLPVWVSEGLAEFFGNSVVVDDRLKAGQATPDTIARVRRAIDAGRSVPFREMLTMTSEAWTDHVTAGDAAGLYEQAWSMIHFLAYGHDSGYRDHFEAYLRRINEGTPSAAAFNDVFGNEIEPFEAAWKAYVLEELKPSSLLTVLERLEFLAEGARALSERSQGENVQVPGSIEELRAALRAIGFEQRVAGHGRTRVLSATDDTLFTVPAGEEQEESVVRGRRRKDTTPRFVLRPGRRRHSMPPTIATLNFEPNDLEVRWSRDRRTRELRYEIVSG